MSKSTNLDGHLVTVSGRLPRLARLREEYHEFVEKPEQFVAGLKEARMSADLFTFVEPIGSATERPNFHLTFDTVAGLPISTYEHWWKKQVNDKTRNMVRKAQKNGVEVRPAEFSDELVNGIALIYNETPIRQGRSFRHYGKPLSLIKAENASFVERSDFLGAYLGSELIGFLKLVHGTGVSHIMQIISFLSHRNRAPMNALLAKAVECCAAREVPLLVYGRWNKRGIGEFKKHHAFEPFEVRRYYSSLNPLGSLLLRCGLHRPVSERTPEKMLERLATWRNRWNAWRLGKQISKGAVAQLAEHRAKAQ